MNDSSDQHREQSSASTQRPLRGWNLWPYVPFIVIGIAVIPNALKIMNAQNHPAHSVEEQPWEASRSFDEQRQARGDFADLGLTMTSVSTVDGGTLLRLSAPQGFNYDRLQAAQILAYRPDAPDLDVFINWPSGQTVLDISHLAAGAWILTFTARLDDTDLRHQIRVHSAGPNTAQRSSSAGE